MELAKFRFVPEREREKLDFFRKPEKHNSARRNSGDFGGIVDLSQWNKKIEIPDSLKTRRLSDADKKADVDISQWNIPPKKKDEPKEEPETPEPSDVEQPAEASDHVEVEVVDETRDASDDAGTSEEAGPSVEDLYGDGPSGNSCILSSSHTSHNVTLSHLLYHTHDLTFRSRH